MKWRCSDVETYKRECGGVAVAVVAGTASEQAAQGRPASVANRVTRVLSSCTPNTPSRADLPLTNIHTHELHSRSHPHPPFPSPYSRYGTPYHFSLCLARYHIQHAGGEKVRIRPPRFLDAFPKQVRPSSPR